MAVTRFAEACENEKGNLSWLRPCCPPLCPGLWLLYAPCNLIRTACLKRTHRSLGSHHSLNEISALITDGQGHSIQHTTPGLRGCHSKASLFHNNTSVKVWLETAQMLEESQVLYNANILGNGCHYL